MAKTVAFTSGESPSMENFNKKFAEIVAQLTPSALGGEIDKKLQQKPNPNLLDNWYFGDPVNQRGETEYTGEGYTIDRWMTGSDDEALTITEDGVLHTGVTAWYGGFTQKFEKPLPPGTYTFSLIAELITGGAAFIIFDGYGSWLSWAGINPGSGLQSHTVTIDGEAAFIRIAPSADNSSIKIGAAKLELGTEQTLAHQDENGNWVLNEIPNYAEELAKCQRYQVAFPAATHWRSTLTTSDFIDFAIPLPANLRATPVVPSSALVVCATTGAGGFTDFSFAVAQYGSQLRVRATKASHGLTDAVLECVSLAVFDANL